MFNPDQEIVGNFSVVDPTFKRILTDATPGMLNHGQFRGEIPHMEPHRTWYFLIVVESLDGGIYYFTIMGRFMPSREIFARRICEILADAAAEAAVRADADANARRNGSLTWDTPICG